MAAIRPKAETRRPARLSLTLKDFNDVIEDHGSFVRITPSIICPRRTGIDIDVDSTNHDLNCPYCRNGIVDLEDMSVEDWVLILGVGLDKVFQPQSRFDIKDAMITCRSGIRLSYFYKIEVLDFGSQFNQLVKKSSLDFDRLRYNPRDPEDGSQFALPDGNGVDYERGVDYDITTGGITWLGANRPPVERLFSILYPVNPTFRVMEMAHENRYYYGSHKEPVKEAQQFPQQAHIRWDFMAFGAGSDVPADGGAPSL